MFEDYIGKLWDTTFNGRRFIETIRNWQKTLEDKDEWNEGVSRWNDKGNPLYTVQATGSIDFVESLFGCIDITASFSFENPSKIIVDVCRKEMEKLKKKYDAVVLVNETRSHVMIIIRNIDDCLTEVYYYTKGLEQMLEEEKKKDQSRHALSRHMLTARNGFRMMEHAALTFTEGHEVLNRLFSKSEPFLKTYFFKRSFDEEAEEFISFVDEWCEKVLSNPAPEDKRDDTLSVVDLFKEGMKITYEALKGIRDECIHNQEIKEELLSFAASTGYNPFADYGLVLFVDQFELLMETALKELKKQE